MKLSVPNPLAPPRLDLHFSLSLSHWACRKKPINDSHVYCYSTRLMPLVTADTPFFLSLETSQTEKTTTKRRMRLLQHVMYIQVTSKCYSFARNSIRKLGLRGFSTFHNAKYERNISPLSVRRLLKLIELDAVKGCVINSLVDVVVV